MRTEFTNMKRLITITAAILVLHGCSNTSQQESNVGINPAEIQLAKASESISKSLIKLAKLQEHSIDLNSKKQDHLLMHNNTDLPGTATIDWSGPIAPIVQRIAKATSFKFRILGIEPTIPVMVHVNMKKAPFLDILKNIHYQANGKAIVKIHGKEKVIELRYALT